MRCRSVSEMTARSIANFWSHVDKTDECWLWTASVFVANGYGQFKGGPSTRAHRVAWELVKGPCPKPPLEPNHKCRVRRCVNPDHIEWVTHKENLEYANRVRNELGQYV
jgi:hypothetical protein